MLPTDADLDTVGPTRTLAYDRAWWFTRFVADRYGDACTAAPLPAGVRASATPTSKRPSSETLGADLDEVLVAWRRWLSRIA